MNHLFAALMGLLVLTANAENPARPTDLKKMHLNTHVKSVDQKVYDLQRDTTSPTAIREMNFWQFNPQGFITLSRSSNAVVAQLPYRSTSRWSAAIARLLNDSEPFSHRTGNETSLIS